MESSIKDKLPGVKENVLMSLHTTFKIGGPARYFFTAKSEKDIKKAVKTAKDFNLPFFILGGGTNLVVSNEGYKGLIIKIQNLNLRVKNCEIHADSGVHLSAVINLSAKNLLTGIEWAAGIPGTVGGAIYGNAGAFGSAMAGNVKKVKVLDIKDLKVREFSGKECRFGNKESIFKHDKNLIIISAVLGLKKGEKEQIQKEIKRFVGHRKKYHPLNLPSAGCFFKNYSKKITNKNLLKKFPELIEFNKGSRIPTSYLIDKAGLKGKMAGRAQISEKHANYIVNLGGAEAIDVLKLAKLIKEKVYDKFRIKLEDEVQKLGF